MKWTHTKPLSHIQTQNSKIEVAAYGVSTLTRLSNFLNLYKVRLDMRSADLAFKDFESNPFGSIVQQPILLQRKQGLNNLCI